MGPRYSQADTFWGVLNVNINKTNWLKTRTLSSFLLITSIIAVIIIVIIATHVRIFIILSYSGWAPSPILVNGPPLASSLFSKHQDNRIYLKQDHLFNYLIVFSSPQLLTFSIIFFHWCCIADFVRPAMSSSVPFLLSLIMCICVQKKWQKRVCSNNPE